MASPETNGSIVGAASRLGQSVITALPAQFLLLVILNGIFIAMVMWFLNSQMDQRTALVTKLVDKCMEIALHENPPVPPH